MDDYALALPPPRFYLSSLQNGGKVWHFTGVVALPSFYNAPMNRQPLLGQQTPYASAGAGQGFSWRVEARLSSALIFAGNGSETGSARASGTPYDELNELEDFIKENGPAPLFHLHRHKRPMTQVAMESFASEIMLSEDNAYGAEPHTISVSMALTEIIPYSIRMVKI